jgi:hypothetical protein
MNGKIAFGSALALLFLAGCDNGAKNAAPPTETAQQGCERTATQVVAFTATDAQDLVETRSFGPDCRNAVVMIIIRRADGTPLYAWSTAQPWVADRTVSVTTGEQMQNFLQRWAQVSVDSTLALPDWPQRQQAFTEQLGAFMSTPLPREQYLDVRSKGAPRLCFATGIEGGTCIYYDAQANTSLKVLDTGS